jgi:hypothetical protein
MNKDELEEKKGWDIDFPFGTIHEEKLKEILTGTKMEIKTEKEKWKETKNIAIELFFRGKPSGLNITKAEYWGQIFHDDGQIEFIILFPVSILDFKVRKLIREGKGRMDYGGDYNETLLALIPLSEILKHHARDNDGGGDPPASDGTLEKDG